MNRFDRRNKHRHVNIQGLPMVNINDLLKRRRRLPGLRGIVGCKRTCSFLVRLAQQGPVKVRVVSIVRVRDGSRLGFRLPPTPMYMFFSVKVVMCGKYEVGTPLIRPLGHM